MALSTQQIDSINTQLETFGPDGVAFDAWMTTVALHVRSHGDVGAFRTQARTMWLSNNKKGVKKLVKDTLSQPTVEEQRALATGDIQGKMFEDAYIRFLTKMGIHKGDVLTVHGSDGHLHSLTLDVAGLPEREVTLLTEPAPTPKGMPIGQGGRGRIVPSVLRTKKGNDNE